MRVTSSIPTKGLESSYFLCMSYIFNIRGQHIEHICVFRLQKDRAVDLEKNVDALKLRLVTTYRSPV